MSAYRSTRNDIEPQQAAPTRADIEHALSWREPQFAAHMIELGLLSLGQPHRRIPIVSTGINPQRVKPEREEFVTDIVMMAHLMGIAQAMVHAP